MNWEAIVAIVFGVYSVLMSFQWSRIEKAVKEWKEAIDVIKKALEDKRITQEEAAAMLKETTEAINVTLPIITDIVAAWRGIRRVFRR